MTDNFKYSLVPRRAVWCIVGLQMDKNKITVVIVTEERRTQ